MMWNSNEKIKERRVALANGGYVEEASEKQKEKKFSAVMAIIIGFIITLEIMVAGAMMLKIDVSKVDGIAVLFSFAVVYFIVVAGLTDK